MSIILEPPFPIFSGLGRRSSGTYQNTYQNNLVYQGRKGQNVLSDDCQFFSSSQKIDTKKLN